MARRPRFFISDGTGLTSESMGEALLDQFEGINFKRTTYPFVDTPEKADAMAVDYQQRRRAKRPASAGVQYIIDNQIRAKSSS